MSNVKLTNVRKFDRAKRSEASNNSVIHIYYVVIVCILKMSQAERSTESQTEPQAVPQAETELLPHQKRYIEKVNSHCGGLDPYDYPWKHLNDVPPHCLTMDGLTKYLIERKSFYTDEQVRAKKSLDAYKYFEAGLIQMLHCRRFELSSVVVAKVKHSMRMNDPALDCWVALNLTGDILSAHCKCMAGLGESCSHVAAVLFALVAWADTYKEQNLDQYNVCFISRRFVIPWRSLTICFLIMWLQDLFLSVLMEFLYWFVLVYICCCRYYPRNQQNIKKISDLTDYFVYRRSLYVDGH